MKTKVYMTGIAIFLFLLLSGYYIPNNDIITNSSTSSLVFQVDEKPEKIDCPYLIGKADNACPYLNEKTDESSSVCPYLEGKMKNIENNEESTGECTYLNQHGDVKKIYKTINNISS